MRPDQKVRDDAIARSTTFSVSPPGDARLQRGIDRERVELNSYVSHRIPDCLAGCEEGAQFRPDDVARRDASLPKTPAKGFGRPRTECWVGAKHVEKDACVDRRDHTASGLPRSESISRSVRRRTLRIP